ncbi:MAG: hypothetical protein KZQ83_11930 [gamma proteobacterium symbiont of Taylorina sp.]|nr:hypothetical protein [gamma proteobacterium symbiont of Taylorina sp.]
MKKLLSILCLSLFLLWQPVFADDVSDTLKVFSNAGESSRYLNNSYGYAVFPTIGKAGIGIGGAYGKGQVYAQKNHVGESGMTQVSIGFQLGAQGYSQIIFFQDKRAFDEFTNGNFEFGATAQAVAITAGVSASANTTGNSATASGGKNNASTASDGYHKGMMVFTVAKGGLMYEASIGGQKFSYTPK